MVQKIIQVIKSQKNMVRTHWEQETCGTRYGISSSREEYFNEIYNNRYKIEPYILSFAEFHQEKGKKVLEIGVGAGSDFYNWVKNGAIAIGVDLTRSAIALTKEHLEIKLKDNHYTLNVADAEALPFNDNQFDLVYSWGVLHHTPDTKGAFKEVYRVLKPNGLFRGMIYHVPSWSGLMMWILHGFLKGNPFMSVKDAIYHHLESPGTKAYTIQEAAQILTDIGFGNLKLKAKLGSGDLLLIKPRNKYQNPLFNFVWKIYPRWLIKLIGDKYGLFLLIEARKSSNYTSPNLYRKNL